MQLKTTLKSIALTRQKNVEIIIVDDASTDRFADSLYGYKFPIKVIKIKPENKWWINPVIPYNIGISYADGDIVVLQNPECLHCGDVLTSVQENTKYHRYLSFSCYFIDPVMTEKLYNSDIKNCLKTLSPLQLDAVENTGTGLGFVNHPTFKPRGYHFLAAITKKNVNLLGGFDERFAFGICWDDDEFVQRATQKLDLELFILDENNPFVVHQHHETVHKFFGKTWEEKYDINRQVFNQIQTESSVKATKLEKEIQHEIRLFV